MGSNISFAWSSILWDQELIQLGLLWRVGDGTQIRINKDPWIPRPPSFASITLLHDLHDSWKVVDFIVGGRWNVLFLEQVF